jgi:Integrase core domain
MGIRDKPIAPASPWQNGFAERLIGSIRRECLDHIIVLGEEEIKSDFKGMPALDAVLVAAAQVTSRTKSTGPRHSLA